MSVNCQFAGLDVEVFMALYDLIKEKASCICTWKGARATKTSGLTEEYIKVQYKPIQLQCTTVWHVNGKDA